MTNPRDEHTYKDWIVTASVKSSEFPMSGYIHFFLSHDEPSGPASEWLHHETLVGSVSMFSSSTGADSYGSSYVGENETTIRGQVLLTFDLVKKGRDCENVEDTESYLRNHLHWRCALVNGKELPLSAVPSLEVKVQSATVHEPIPNPDSNEIEFPTREPFKVHHGVTHGKVGGYSTPQ